MTSLLSAILLLLSSFTFCPHCLPSLTSTCVCVSNMGFDTMRSYQLFRQHLHSPPALEPSDSRKRRDSCVLSNSLTQQPQPQYQGQDQYVQRV